jgi:hypothetical protein
VHHHCDRRDGNPYRGPRLLQSATYFRAMASRLRLESRKQKIGEKRDLSRVEPAAAGEKIAGRVVAIAKATDGWD